METLSVFSMIAIVLQYFFLSVVIFKIFEMIGEEKPNKAYVPIYRYYELFKVYKGRAYKRDYSKLFLLIVVLAWFLNLINKLFYSDQLESPEELLKSNDAAMNLVAMYGNKILLLTAVVSLLSLIVELGALLPLVKELWLKLIVIVVNIVSFIVTMWTYLQFLTQYKDIKGMDYDKVNKIFEIKQNIAWYAYVGTIFYLFLITLILYICQSYYKKFLNGQDVIVSLKKDNDNTFRKRNYSIFK